MKYSYKGVIAERTYLQQEEMSLRKNFFYQNY